MPSDLPIIDIKPSPEARSSIKKSISYQKETRDCWLVFTAVMFLAGLFSWAQHWQMLALILLVGAGLSLVKWIRLDQALKAKIEELSSLKTVIVEDEN